MKILIEQKSYYRDCCEEQDMVIFEYKEKCWDPSIYYCKHCGQLWEEEMYHGSCSGDRDYRWNKLNGKIKRR